jgi:hypothetical protein
MFFENRDDLSELLYEMKHEFENQDTKKFVIRQIASYDELSFEIINRYIPKFNRWIKENSGRQAEVLTKRLVGVQTSRTRDMFSNSDKESTEYVYDVGIFIVWTGLLPSTAW